MAQGRTQATDAGSDVDWSVVLLAVAEATDVEHRGEAQQEGDERLPIIGREVVVATLEAHGLLRKDGLSQSPEFVNHLIGAGAARWCVEFGGFHLPLFLLGIGMSRHWTIGHEPVLVQYLDTYG
ncbi:hypothetical protein CMI48_04815 [Candidatus Pacearchaeota archaeon]|nr:hypothetical protein [Candidatus Pacearchaeota archaeon]